MAKIVASLPMEYGHGLTLLEGVHALVRRGHAVVCFAHPDRREAAESTGARFVPNERLETSDVPNLTRHAAGKVLATPPPKWVPASAVPTFRRRQLELTFRKQLLIGAGRTADDLAALLRREKPDAVLVDCFCFGARYAADMTSTPFVTLAADPTFALNAKGTLALPPRPWMSHLPAAPWRWVVDAALPVGRVRAQKGVPKTSRVAEFYRLMVSDTLHLSTAIPEMMRLPSPPSHRFVGPIQYEWPRPSPDPVGRSFAPGTILVTGTTTGRPSAVEPFVHIATSIAKLGRPTVIVAGHAPVPKDLGSHVKVFESVRYAEVVPWASVVVTHGGWGTVGRALRAGVPMVVTPAFGPQPMIAERLGELGLAEWIAPEEVTPDRLRAALDAVSNDEAMRARLRAVEQRLVEKDPATAFADAFDATFG